MKKILTLILASMALSLPMTAQAAEDKPSSTPITLDAHTENSKPNPTVLRTPIRISVEAWYDASTNIISIRYYGEATGEVKLYRDGQLIDNSSEINTIFYVSESGFYTIEINAESWSATGSIDIR
ncbi:MAG: hypothetical protein K2K98_01035 [Muribaculaceae bacterium]|nr:hypothetical protein [Muribaculaceae bacterium]